MKKPLLRPVLLSICLLLSACAPKSPASPATSSQPPALPSQQAPDRTPAPETPEPSVVSPDELLAEAASQALFSAPGEPVLRKFPYPYRAMLCVTSDCDSTTTETFTRMHRFLNTFEETEYGTGLGLDIADSFFVYNGSNYGTADNLLTYCEGTDPNLPRDAGFIKKYYLCGWIDSIHALGDFSSSTGSKFSRELAVRAWELLSLDGIAPKVWIDHGTYTNVQNFGAYNPKNASSYQAGDDPESVYYHTDVTLSQSIRYVWHSRHSDSFGQDFPLSAKTLRDGREIWSFSRYTSEINGREIIWTWRPNRLHDQITGKRLDELEENGRYAVIAQHLTVFQEQDQPGKADIEALRLLAERFHEKRSILVARTSRLMDYALAQKYLGYETAENDGYFFIRILSIDDPVLGKRTPEPEELSGLTFYCSDPERTAILYGDAIWAYDNLQRNSADETGRVSVSIPWFSMDTTDYSAAD